MDDHAAIARQIGRAPRAFRRVAARCPHGAPAVTEQEPYDAEGTPFPTTYYLTCEALVAAVSRIEAAGGVERWSERLAVDAELRADHDRATAEQREVRRAIAVPGPRRDGGDSLGTGIGGSRNPGQLKCLHAHVAYALAHPGYRLGEAVLAEVAAGGRAWPDHCCLEEASAS